MERHFSARTAASAAAILALGVLAGCDTSTPPPVQAKIEALGSSDGVDVELADGSSAYLTDGTAVAAICVDGEPFAMRVKVKSGYREGDIALYVARNVLRAVNNPYDTHKNDPFGPLPACDGPF